MEAALRYTQAGKAAGIPAAFSSYMATATRLYPSTMFRIHAGLEHSCIGNGKAGGMGDI
jgi:hypothetical protein